VKEVGVLRTETRVLSLECLDVAGSARHGV
jgi:hypothetical protein